MAFSGSWRSSDATNAPSACHSCSVAAGFGISAGDAWSSTPTHERRSRGATPTRAAVAAAGAGGSTTRSAVEQPREHDDARERDDDRDPVPRAHALRGPTSSSARLNPPLVARRSAATMTMPSRASSDQPRRSALRTARTSTVDDRAHEADRRGEPELRGREPFPSRLVEMVGERRERTEAVRGHRAQQLDDPERIGLRVAAADGRGRRAGSWRAASGRASVGRLASERRRESDARRRAPAITQPARPAARERAHHRADGQQRQQEREVVDAGHADQHRAEEQPPHPAPRRPVPELGDRRQRGVGPEDLHAQEHDDRHADVEREVLVRRAVAEVVRREREQHRADERRRPRAAQRPQHRERDERGERERQQPEQVEA